MQLIVLAKLMYLVQLAHSYEELKTGFHKKWYLFKMPFKVFLIFELLFNLFWAVVIFSDSLPYKNLLLIIWIVLMTLNGAQHVVWAIVSKKYVPGLYTAPLHLGLTFMYLSR